MKTSFVKYLFYCSTKIAKFTPTPRYFCGAELLKFKLFNKQNVERSRKNKVGQFQTPPNTLLCYHVKCQAIKDERRKLKTDVQSKLLMKLNY
jgi:hypothetical protein